MTPEMIHAFQRDRKLVLTEKGITYRTVRRLSLEASPHTIDCQERAMEFLSDLFDYRPTEALYAIALNSCNDLLGMILLSNGTVDRATVYPRELVSFLLHETNSTGLILCHNHPGGREEASPQDIALTKHLMEVMKPLHIPIKLSTDSGESFHEYSGGMLPLIPVQTIQSFSLLAQQDCCFRFSL